MADEGRARPMSAIERQRAKLAAKKKGAAGNKLNQSGAPSSRPVSVWSAGSLGASTSTQLSDSIDLSHQDTAAGYIGVAGADDERQRHGSKSLAEHIDDIDLGDGSVAPMASGSASSSSFAAKMSSAQLDAYQPPDLRFQGDQETTKAKKEDAGFSQDDLASLRDYICQPLPMGQKVLCTIERRRHVNDAENEPNFVLHLEIVDSFKGKTLSAVLGARKMKKSKTSYYAICRMGVYQQPGFPLIAKLRANMIGTHFSLYDGGINPAKQDLPENRGRSLREEMAAIQYESNVLGFKGPRKMTVYLPALGSEDATPIPVVPTNEEDGMLSRVKAGHSENIMLLRNKKPTWNEQSNSYVLNFHGRVTEASVKNFQLVHESNEEYIVLQFGRIGANRFTMDVQHPMSILQGFAVCLSSFDGKLAVE